MNHLMFRTFLIVGCLFMAGKMNALGLDPTKVRDSVLRIYNPGGDSTGSGFIVHATSKEAVVATNAHVISGFQKSEHGTVFLLRKRGRYIELYEGIVLAQDDWVDMALILVPGLKGKTLPLFTTDPLQGEEVYSLGFPGLVDDHESEAELVQLFESQKDTRPDQSWRRVEDTGGRASRVVEPTFSKAGIRRVVDGKWNPQQRGPEFRIVEHDVNIGPGNSGGPLFNACGHVVGVNTLVDADNVMTGAVRKSSHASVLSQFLNQNNYSHRIVTAPCRAGAGGLGTTAYVILIVALGGGVVAVFIALKNPRVIQESYTQFLRRSPMNQSGGGASVARQTPPPPPKKALPRPVAEHWMLVGINPESGHRADITLSIDPAAASRAGGRLIVGRHEGLVHLHVSNTSLSGQHATLIIGASSLSIEDRNSSNGTKVNGTALTPFSPTIVEAGDRIELGEVKLQVRHG